MLNAPLNVHWELTNRCNLACVHCYQQDDDYDLSLPDPDELLLIAKRIAEARVFELTLTGGEIFLVQSLFDIVDTVNLAGISPHITTNGTLVDEALARKLSKRDVTVQVSLDAATSDIHDRIRGRRGAFTQAVRGLALMNERGVKTSISMTLMPTNMGTAHNVMDLAASIGVQRVCVGEVLPYFGDSREALQNSNSEMSKSLDALRAKAKQYGDSVDLRLAVDQRYAPQDVGPENCTSMSRDLAILHDGYAYPCPFVRGRQYRIGRVADSPLSDLWSGEKARSIRDRKAASRRRMCVNNEARREPSSGQVLVSTIRVRRGI